MRDERPTHADERQATRPARPPVPRLPAVERVEHGGPDFAELAALGVRPDAIFDFSVNKNPLGASPRALRAVEFVDPSSYPDARCLRLRGGLAAFHDVRPEMSITATIWRWISDLSCW